MLVWDGKEYDSKAIAGAACAYQPSVGTALTSSEFSGGETGAAARLRALGFTVRSTAEATPALQVTRDSVLAAIAEWDTIGRDAFLAKYRASPAQRYMVVVSGNEYDAQPLVQVAWAVAHPDQQPLEARDFRGDRGGIAEPLRDLGFWVVRTDQPSTPGDAPLGHDPQRYLDTAAQLQGSLDKPTSTTSRQEQDLLRGVLGLFRDGASECGLCGRTFPNELLIAAHIKKRADCTDVERLDLKNIAMPACLLGCDALFERGFIAVSQSGKVIVADVARAVPALADALAVLESRSMPSWAKSTEPYFAWHRSHTYRR